MSKPVIAVAPGDGIGPEIMRACLKIFEAAGVTDLVEFQEVAMGEKVFASGDSRGMTDDAIDTVERVGLLYKGPMGTPVGGGGKSINVSLRKMFGAYANARHFRTLPGVETVFSKAGVDIDCWIVRENVEDTYGGIEHRLTNDVIECKRLISAPGCDQVHRFAFETARRLGIKTVHCAHKANIMKLTDGLFLERFRATAEDFTEIETGDVIVDALCMKMVISPDAFEMIVLPNFQGDIVSDLAAGLVGGLGFAPSANIGDRISIFEAVHGTAPDIAGKGIANPTSLLLSGLMMLRHIGLLKTAAVIENALLAALEDGVCTGDFASGRKPVGTAEFASAVIDRLGKSPSETAPRQVPGSEELSVNPPERPHGHRLMRTFETLESHHCGCDIYIDTTLPPAELAMKLQSIAEGTPFDLTMISNRGTQVWPSGSLYTELVDYYRVRFEARANSGELGQTPAIELLQRVGGEFAITDFQPLKNYDGKPGFSKAQGQ